MSRFCTSCGRAIDGESTCASCAGSTPRSLCASCNHENVAGSRYCAACGSSLRDAEAMRVQLFRPQGVAFSADSQAAERREVTVVFVDATEFTAVSTRLDSEDVYSFIDEAMKLLVEVVAIYDGTVDKFTGDGLMALFGAPIAHEDDAERAVRCAWEMQRAIVPLRERLLAQHGFQFRIRIGVHTGDVVAGRIGSDTHAEYTVIGDTVNLAARLQSAAEPDSVYVSDCTHARTASNFKYEAVPELHLKGISGAVTAYRVVAPLRRMGASRGLPGVAIPMVGREEPLAILQQTLGRVEQDSRFHVVAISGDAGVGKTRLVDEFSRRLPHHIRCVTAQCFAVTRSRPFVPVAEIVRKLAGIDGSDVAANQLDLLRAFVNSHALPVDETLPYLAGLIGVAHADGDLEAITAGVEPQILQSQTHVAVRRAVVASASRKPLLIVIDDLHWVDSASLDLLRFFVQSEPPGSLMFVAVTRHLERSTALRSFFEAVEPLEERFKDLELGPLRTADAKRLVRELIPDPGPRATALRNKIIARADGNPLYVEELVRMLLDRGAVVAGNDALTVTDEAEVLLRQLPATLRGLMLARFDAVPIRLRQVLQRAAVLGRSFPVRLLQDLLAGQDSDVATSLEELEACGFVRQEAFGLERGFTFTHVLIQEAIHSTILKRDRQQMHRDVAEAIEGGHYFRGADREDALAFHWSESAEPLRAVPYLLAAAEYSSRRYANDAAVEHARRALTILTAAGEEGEPLLRARLLLGRSLKVLGRLSEAVAVVQEGANSLYNLLHVHHATLPRVQMYIEFLRELADVEAREGALDRAVVHLEEAALALAEWPELECEPLRRIVLDRMAWVRFRQGKLDDALVRADELVRILTADADADPAVLASAYNTLGGVLWQFGKVDAATDAVRKSLALYHKIGYLFGKANSHTNLGVLLAAQGKWAEAAQSFERSDWIRREIGYVVGRASNVQNLALLRMAMGDHDAAGRDFEASLRIAEQLGEELEIVHALIGLTHLAITTGDTSKAMELLERLRPFEPTLGSDEVVQIQWMRAVVESAQSIDRAIEIANEGCKVARQSGLAESECDCSRILGSLYARRGDAAAAESALRSSLQTARKIGDPYREALALLELGTMYPKFPITSGTDAKPLLEEAMRLFLKLGAAYDARRASSALQIAG